MAAFKRHLVYPAKSFSKPSDKTACGTPIAPGAEYSIMPKHDGRDCSDCVSVWRKPLEWR